MIFRLLTGTLLPVVLAIGLYLLDTRTTFRKLTYWQKQVIFGIAFGILACLATQFGVKGEVGGQTFVLNVRSAPALTAGLVFGGPAGLIAGTMGALYRWFCIYWIAGAVDTRIACSLGTLVAGIVGALCRRFMFSGKKTSWFYGLFIAVSTEVFHMLLVFFTNMRDIEKAFSIVKVAALPMIISNTVSLCLSLLAVALLSRENRRAAAGGKITARDKRPLTSTFALYLLLCVTVSFLATMGFTNTLQSNLAEMEVENLLSMNIGDVESDIQIATDNDLLQKAMNLSEEAPFLSANSVNPISVYTMSSYAKRFGVSEIDLVDGNGIIWASNIESNIGFDMKPGEQSSEFMCLLDGETKYYVQPFQAISKDDSVYRKYAGVPLTLGGFLQVGYDKELFQKSVSESLASIADNRHIGENGFVFILSSAGNIISAPTETVTAESVAAFAAELSDKEPDTVLTHKTEAGDEYYYSFTQVEGYTVVGCIPVSEADFSRNLSIYINGFMQLLVFFILFTVVFFLIKYVIVNNIHKINESLAKITGGDLNTKVDIHESEEFSTLSADINATVARLKDFIADAEARIDLELSYAKSIQHSVLPSVFPPYPNRHEFDIYAAMHTAKEVGGDFYDFYLLGQDKLVILIADVSGKGIPAAMFMMNAKSVIKSLAESGLSVSEVFTAANEKLCAENATGMFVTAWMGILDVKTGVMHFANAGHNPPLLKQGDGKFTYLKTRPGLVLAGMEGMTYRENEVVLKPGDEIYLYTDGVTEATSAATELFGEERLVATLNGERPKDAEDVCRTVKAAVDAFVGEAPQFDDITMLSLRYFGDKKEEENGMTLTLPATVENIEKVTDFVDGILESADATPKSVMQINVAIDELFGNIAHYAYGGAIGDATVDVTLSGDVVSLTFKDGGTPFDPLAKEDPDVHQSAADRPIGGLGIFMVKKTMDDVRYEYRDGQNRLTIVKKIK